MNLPACMLNIATQIDKSKKELPESINTYAGLSVFLALQPIVVVFPQPGSGF
jgi:hypothetical protein